MGVRCLASNSRVIKGAVRAALHVDGLINAWRIDITRGAGVGVVIFFDDRLTVEQVLRDNAVDGLLLAATKGVIDVGGRDANLVGGEEPILRVISKGSGAIANKIAVVVEGLGDGRNTRVLIQIVRRVGGTVESVGDMSSLPR